MNKKKQSETRGKIIRSLKQIAATERSNVEFANKIGESKQAVSNWFAGRNTPDIETIAKISSIYHIPVSTIFSGNVEDVPRDTVDYTTAPLFGKIAAGVPVEMLPITDEFVIPSPLKERYPKAFWLEVSGESMNKKLPNGSYALVNPTNDVINGRVYAVCVNGFDATVKKVRKLDNGFELIPDSTDPTFKPKVYDYGIEGTETITVIGQVVWFTIPFDFVI